MRELRSSDMITTKVCIIGAGVSGLRAANVLLNAPNSPFSADDVVILEAQDRIGGRIKTDTTQSKLGLQYDLGAAWFHDALTNSVLHQSISDGDFDATTDGYFDDKDVAFYCSEKEGKLDVAGLKLNRVVEDIEKFIELHFSDGLDVPDVSLDEIIRLYMEKYGQFLTEDQKLYCGRIIRYLELWFGISQRDISAKYAVMDHQGRNLYNKKGFSFVIEKLRRKTPCDLMLKQQVKSLERDRKSGPKNLVTTTSGTVVGADYVVVTVPHSILALPSSDAYGIEWKPSLPQHVTDSLKSIHFGSLGKVILEFQDVWWDSAEDRIEVLADESVTASENMIVPFQYPIYIINYARVFPGAASLVVLLQSPVTEYIEANPDSAWDYLKPMVSKLQVKPMSDPINVIVSDWTVNPFARGSYSAVYVGDDPSDEIIQLSGEHDVCGLGASSRVRFAGEHTIADAAGCVHGAYNSGQRAAEWILNNEREGR